MDANETVRSLMITVLVVNVALWSALDSSYQHQQTALLQQLVAQTKPPVSIQVSGFSPEAQRVFNQAVKAERKGK